MIVLKTVALGDPAGVRQHPSEIVRDLTPDEIQSAEDVWYPALLALLQSLLQSGVTRRDLPEHKHWEWQREARRFYNVAGYEFWGVRTGGRNAGADACQCEHRMPRRWADRDAARLH